MLCLFCRQLALQQSRWRCLKQIAELSECWMEAKWEKFDSVKASQQLNTATGLTATVCSGAASEVGGTVLSVH